MLAGAFFCAHGYFVDVGRQTPRFIFFPTREDFHTSSRSAQKRPVFSTRGYFFLLLTAHGGKRPFFAHADSSHTQGGGHQRSQPFRIFPSLSVRLLTPLDLFRAGLRGVFVHSTFSRAWIFPTAMALETKGSSLFYAHADFSSRRLGKARPKRFCMRILRLCTGQNGPLPGPCGRGYSFHMSRYKA